MIISNVTVDHDNITWMRICIWVLHANKVKRSKTSHCKHHKYMYSFANLNIPFVLVFRMKSTCYTLHEVSDLLISVYEVPNKNYQKRWTHAYWIQKVFGSLSWQWHEVISQSGSGSAWRTEGISGSLSTQSSGSLNTNLPPANTWQKSQRES